MAFSGQIKSTTTAKNIIQEALELLGAVSEGELANSAQEASLLRTLNNLCVAWQSDGLNLFSVTYYYIFLEADRFKYRIPDPTTRIATGVERNFTAAAAVETATSIDVEEEVPSNHDTVGVLLEDLTMFWSTIISAVDKTIIMNDSLPDDVIEGAQVYTYEDSVITRPMKTLSGHVYQQKQASIPMDHLSREGYETLTNKRAKGIPLQFYYDPQVTYGDVYIWPTPSRNDNLMELHVQRQLDTAVNVANDVEYPAEWFLPLATNLAYVSSAKYGVPRFDYLRLEALADKYYTMAKDFDFEWGTSLEFSPDRRGE